MAVPKHSPHSLSAGHLRAFQGELVCESSGFSQINCWQEEEISQNKASIPAGLYYI